MHLHAAVLFTAFIASSVFAQHDRTITLELRISDPVLSIGEVQHVEVWAVMDPDIPAWVWIPSKNKECFVFALGQARLNIVNRRNAETGTWSDLEVNPDIPINLPGTVTPEGSIKEVFALQMKPWIVLGSPIFVWSAKWTPNGYTTRSVDLQTEPFKPDVQWVLIDCGVGDTQLVVWDPILTRATFQVGCPADCEEDGDLDVFDFLCFQGEFAAQASYADCELDGDWDVFDFLCYQQLYSTGCG